MRDKWPLIFMMVIGSFLVYCAEDVVMTNHGDLGMSKADAQMSGSCCDPSTPTTLFDQALSATTPDAAGFCYSDPIDISQYRTIVVHNGIGGSIEIQAKHGSAGFVRHKVLNSGDNPSEILDARMGTSMRVQWYAPMPPCAPPPGAVTIVGYKN
jgi:hypothetical protein